MTAGPSGASQGLPPSHVTNLLFLGEAQTLVQSYRQPRPDRYKAYPLAKNSKRGSGETIYVSENLYEKRRRYKRERYKIEQKKLQQKNGAMKIGRRRRSSTRLRSAVGMDLNVVERPPLKYVMQLILDAHLLWFNWGVRAERPRMHA